VAGVANVSLTLREMRAKCANTRQKTRKHPVKTDDFMSPDIVFHALAGAAYGLLGAALWRALARRPDAAPAMVNSQTHQTRRTRHINRVWLPAALLLHGAGLQQSILAGPGLALNWALALSAAAWLGLTLYWLENLVHRMDGLQLLLLPGAGLVALLAALFPATATTLPVLADDWLRAHLLIALAAYGLMTVAALHALLMAALDRRLHRPASGVHAALPGHASLATRLLDDLPPLLAQERLLFRVIWVGFLLLTLTVLTGAHASYTLSARWLPFDHKTVFTLLSWLTFGLLLIGRAARGWRGRVALRGTLAGFALLLLAYTGTHFVLEVILKRT